MSKSQNNFGEAFCEPIQQNNVFDGAGPILINGFVVTRSHRVTRSRRVTRPFVQQQITCRTPDMNALCRSDVEIRSRVQQTRPWLQSQSLSLKHMGRAKMGTRDDDRKRAKFLTMATVVI